MDRFYLVKYVILISILVLGISIIIANYIYIRATKDSIQMQKESGPRDDLPIFDEQGNCIVYDQFGDKNIQDQNGQKFCLRYDRGNRQFAYGTSEHESWQFFCGYRGDDGKNKEPCFRVARGGKFEPDNKYYCGHHNPNFAFTVVVIEDSKNPKVPTYIVENDLDHDDEAYGSPENFLAEVKSSKSYKKYVESRGGESQVNWVISKSYSYIGHDKVHNTIRQTKLLALRIILRSFARDTRQKMQLIHEDLIEDLNFILIPDLISNILETDHIFVDFENSKISPPDLTKGNPDDYFLYHVPVRFTSMYMGFYVGKSQVDQKVIEVTEPAVTAYTSSPDTYKFMRVTKEFVDEAEFCARILLILASTQPEIVELNRSSVNLAIGAIEPGVLKLENMGLYQKISQHLFSQKFNIEIKGDLDWTYNPFEGGRTIHLEPQSSNLEIKSKGKIRNMAFYEVRNFLIKMQPGSEIRPREDTLHFNLVD